ASSISGVTNLVNSVTPQCLVVLPPPLANATLTKAFSPQTIEQGGISTLTFTLTNSAGNPAQAGINFTDTLPSNVVIAGVPNISSSCPSGAGVVSATAGGGTITITGASLNNVQTNCTISINVTSNVPGGPYNNTAANISGTAQITNAVTTSSLTVVGYPSLTKIFSPSSIVTGGVSNLIFSLTKASTSLAITGASFIDTLPTGLRITSGATAQIQGSGCSGQVTLTAPSQIAVSNLAMDTATTNCTITVTGISNANGALNPSCANAPAAFTNTAASISGITKLNNAVQNACLIVVDDAALMMTAVKSISASQGISPSGSYTVTFKLTNPADGISSAQKSDVSITDPLPAGMVVVPGTLKIKAGTNLIELLDQSGTYSQGTLSGSYTVGSSNESVNLTINQMAAGTELEISFDITIAAGIATDSILKNTGTYTYTNSQKIAIGNRSTNTVDFRITGADSVTLKGETITTAEPGSVVTFQNVLTNTSTRADTFDITLSGSTFPSGTTLRLYKPDGTTLLADTDGNGIPDTGLVAAGASYTIIVKATLPAGIVGGPYKVRKNAQSVTNPLVRAADDDILTTVARVCRVTMEPDNTGQVAPGGSIVYSHALTNVGGCEENITFPTDFLTTSVAGWASQVLLDNPITGGQSTPGTADPTDTVVAGGNSFTMRTGDRTIVMVRMTAPANAADGATNIARLRVNAGSSGQLTNTDTTTVASAANPNDVIQGYIDNGFQRPSVTALINRDFYLRAVAGSCNQQPDVIERRTVIITGPNGESEKIVIIETDPNTGIFTAEGMQVHRPPITAQDRILQGNANDIFNIEIIGCGRKISTTVTLIDPNGTVFDSLNNRPVSGATVRLFTAQGGQCSNTAATVNDLVGGKIVPAPSVIVTGEDGRFSFPLVDPGDYCMRVTPPNGYSWTSIVPVNRLPAGRTILG
ncbi:MAG: carboxypeptidase regulatory-like domain-containing protein, partial [Betaproteobacteria bacterium]|nr:carboxypeptidase regulatory-like domain-containing protein [Betaproteobacteria bacterium]